MSTLPEFLLARIAEDEEDAQNSQGGEWSTGGRRMWAQPEASAGWEPIAPGWVLTEPRHLLAECEAKRRIIDWAAPVSCDYKRIPTNKPGVYDTQPLRYVSDDGHDLLCILALPYADHPDYREEWKL